MSLSGSTAEDYNKTGDAMLRKDDASGPAPTPENPGGVYPQVSSQSAPAGSIPGSGAADSGGDVRGVFGNPHQFQETFQNLTSAFSSAINSIKDEAPSGVGSKGKVLIGKLEAMRAEIEGWVKGEGLEEAKQVGERNEDVTRAEGDGGGLYKD